MLWTAAGAGSSRNCTATAAWPATRCTGPGGPCTPDDLLTDRQRERLVLLFSTDDHVEIEATWGIYQRMIAAYRDPDRTRAREAMRALIGCLRDGVPAPLTELRRLGRTLTQRAADVLAYFDRPGTSNGPTEALNGRLEQPARLPWASAT